MSPVAHKGNASQPGRIRLWLGHYDAHIMNTVLIFAVIYVWLQWALDWFASSHESLWSWKGLLFVFLAAIIVYSETRLRSYHDTNLCLHCAKRLWGPEQADEKLAWLRFYHNLTRVVVALTVSVAFVVIMFVYQGVNLSVVATFTILVAVDVPNIWTTMVHKRLIPWCPYCRGWEDGGVEEIVPDPVPTNKLTL